MVHFLTKVIPLHNLLATALLLLVLVEWESSLSAADTGYFQFLLTSLLAVLILGVKVAAHGFSVKVGTRFWPPRGETRTSKSTCLLLAAPHV